MSCKEVEGLQLIRSFKVRAPFIDGIGAVDRILERFVTGVTGEGPTGYEVKIRQIYKASSNLSLLSTVIS